jgi:hypothetical protein
MQKGWQANDFWLPRGLFLKPGSFNIASLSLRKHQVQTSRRAELQGVRPDARDVHKDSESQHSIFNLINIPKCTMNATYPKRKGQHRYHSRVATLTTVATEVHQPGKSQVRIGFGGAHDSEGVCHAGAIYPVRHCPGRK